MKTKTNEIHKDVIICSIADLLNYGDKITKTTIKENIDAALYRLITLGYTDITLFPNYESYDEAELIYKQLYK
jgi:hypothetical protein